MVALGIWLLSRCTCIVFHLFALNYDLLNRWSCKNIDVAFKTSFTVIGTLRTLRAWHSCSGDRIRNGSEDNSEIISYFSLKIVLWLVVRIVSR